MAVSGECVELLPQLRHTAPATTRLAVIVDGPYFVAFSFAKFPSKTREVTRSATLAVCILRAAPRAAHFKRQLRDLAGHNASHALI